jgi:hypothetical protein
MSWKDLLQKPNESTVLVWTGGRLVRSFDRTWSIEGKLPPEHGWHEFKIEGRWATWKKASEPNIELLGNTFSGYLIGNRVISDGVAANTDPSKILGKSEEVLFLPDGLDKFARVKVGCTYENGPYIFMSPAFPLGPENEVLSAFLDGRDSVSHIKGVAPALDVAFRLETLQREETRRRREELERLRRIEEERRAVEERRHQLVRQLGDAVGRRQMAVVDFDEAARSALAVGGASFLDARRGISRNEMVVRFRYADRRFECTCDKQTLRIIDSGICLVNDQTGEKGDTFFTLESLPGVIREAIDDDKLVIFRHAN